MTLDTEQGGFKGLEDIRIEEYRSDRGRSILLDNLNKKGKVSLSDSKWQFLIYRQDKITGERTSSGYTNLLTDENFSNAYYYRFMLKKRDGSAITVNDVFPQLTIYFENNIVESCNLSNGYNYDLLTIGTFSGSSISTDVNNETRLRSETMIFQDYGTLYSKVLDANCNIILYKEKNGVVSSSSLTTIANTAIEPNVKYRILVRRNNNETFVNYATPLTEILYLKMEKKIEGIEDLENYKQLIKANAENTLRQSYINQFAFNDLDDGYISIGFDDGVYDVNDAIEYCHSKGVPCYYSLIPSRATGNVETMINNLLSYGGEILSHNATVITPEVQADKELMFNLFFNTKYALENQFNTEVHGIIMAGGTGQNTEDKSLDDKWSRCAGYEYSDYYGNTVPYTLGRKNLTRYTHAQQEAELQHTKSNHLWQMWFCHHVNGEEKNSYPEGYTLNDFK